MTQPFSLKPKTHKDEHTEFTEDILEVPGRTTGKLPKIDSLSDYSEKIQKQVDKVERLPENVLKLKDSREISLPDNKIGIEDGRDAFEAKYGHPTF